MKCSGVYGRLQDVTNFECVTYKGNHMVGSRIERIDVGDGPLKCADKFCYLDDMIGAGGGAEASSIMSQMWVEEVQVIVTIADNKRTFQPHEG